MNFLYSNSSGSTDSKCNTEDSSTPQYTPPPVPQSNYMMPRASKHVLVGTFHAGSQDSNETASNSSTSVDRGESSKYVTIHVSSY